MSDIAQLLREIVSDYNCGDKTIATEKVRVIRDAAFELDRLTEANIGLTRLSVFWRNEGVENDKARNATGRVFRLIRDARKELENEVIGEESLCVITDLLAEAETLYSATKADRAPIQFCVVTSVPGEKELTADGRIARIRELEAEVARLKAGPDHKYRKDAEFIIGGLYRAYGDSALSDNCCPFQSTMSVGRMRRAHRYLFPEKYKKEEAGRG